MDRSSMICALLIIMMGVSTVDAQQITVGRIDAMPNRPMPYEMRDWAAVARSYDSLVFDLNRTGQHLPLVRLNTSTINYPSHASFGLHSVVGTTAPTSGEAINAIPAVIGASLVGIDKRSQFGRDWVLMCEEWFNKRPAENVYLNHPSASSGDDWWYETMPNVFFYQLYDQYRGTGDFAAQFTTVADRWLQALGVMGGSATPWRVPNVNHRAWRLSDMTPNDNGVKEPEAAGAIAWLLYNAYLETGRPEYRKGSEWAMEYLNNQSINPSYELQLAYGVLTAARMNAELGTTYNISKFVNWCFDVGPLRNWGTIVGTWGGRDCSGLIGEVNGINDYAFAMNTFEQIGALVPVVRYDDRFARAIGKWVLNAANASRLFYPSFLPPAQSDTGYSWSAQYDPSSSIAYEALRQSQNGQSPYATGDALSGGWGMTNLALYGSSHVGILGAIIDTTNVPMILKLDLLATDYFHGPAYPSFLLFNPDTIEHMVELDAGSGLNDVYDAVSNAAIVSGASGGTLVTVPADGVVLAVIIPSGGTVTYEHEKMLVNGIVADYTSGQPVANHPPRIKALSTVKTLVAIGDNVGVYCTATDRDGDAITYAWTASGGAVSGAGTSVTWGAPDSAGEYAISCSVTDGSQQVSDTVRINVVVALNHPPVISGLSAQPRKIDLGGTSQLLCTALDTDGDSLIVTWSAAQGSILGTGPSIVWTAPLIAGNVFVHCMVDDGRGGQTRDSIAIVVRDFSQPPSGSLLASYPFNGNADDISGNGHHGTVSNVVSVNDRSGSPGGAYAFNGLSSSIVVPNDAGLNVTSAITVAFWMTVKSFYLREQYPISHGNYTGRWKVSISDKKLRWTLNTSSGIRDLDSKGDLTLDSLYHVAVLYDGLGMEIYLNGALDAAVSWSGSIMTTSIALTMGQALPGDNSVNFNGILDDVNIYDYALQPAAIEQLSGGTTGVRLGGEGSIPLSVRLDQNFPNPFNGSTTFQFSLPPEERPQMVTLEIYDILGRSIAVPFSGPLKSGPHLVRWDAGPIPTGIYYVRLNTPQSVLSRPLLILR